MNSKQDYFNDSRMSRGDYLNFKRSAKEGSYKVAQGERKVTDAMSFGKAFHTFMEVDGDVTKFNEDVAVFDDEMRPLPQKDYRTALNKHWKQQFFEDNEDKTVISVDDFVKIAEMRESITDTDFYKRLANNDIKKEVEYYSKTEKCLCDAVVEYDKRIVIIDWKTTSDKLSKSERGTAWTIKKWDLQVQQEHYTNVVKEVTGKDVVFVFMFVETSAPFECLPVIIDPDSDLAASGKVILDTCKENHAKYLAGDITGISDGLEAGILTIK